MPLANAYLESQVLTADPLELVRLLYRSAADATHRAAAHLAAGRIAERSRQISKAYAILSYLSSALDPSNGGTLSRSLAELYDYMQRRLLEANARQRPEPLAEVEGLLTVLLQGWEKIRPAGENAPGPGYPAVPHPAPESRYDARSWSF